MSKAVPASEGKIANRTSPEQSRSLSASNWTKARVADSALNAFENAMTNKKKTDNQSNSTSTAQPATQSQQTAKVSTNLSQSTAKSVTSSNYVASPSGSASRANVESASADTRTSVGLSSSGGSSRNRSSISPTSDAALAMPAASPVRHSTSTSSSLNASGSAAVKTLPTTISTNVSSSNSQEQPNSPSFLIQHSAQQLQLLESRFKFLTQTLKEKVAQPLFGVDTQITKSNEADAATAKIQELDNFYSSLASLLSRQLDAHRKMVEVERELGLFFLEKGLKEQEGPLRTSLIELGSAYQTVAKEGQAHTKSLESFNQQVSTFLDKAVDDALDTAKRQSFARTELDASTIKLIPQLPPNLQSNIQTFGQNLAGQFKVPLFANISMPFASRKPGNSAPESLGDNNATSEMQSKPTEHTIHQEPTIIPPELSNPQHKALEDRYFKLTAQLIAKCEILENKKLTDLTEQILHVRKSAAARHYKCADAMVAEVNNNFAYSNSLN